MPWKIFRIFHGISSWLGALELEDGLKNLSVLLVTSINARSWNFKVKMRLARPWPTFFCRIQSTLGMRILSKELFLLCFPFCCQSISFRLNCSWKKKNCSFKKSDIFKNHQIFNLDRNSFTWWPLNMQIQVKVYWSHNL